MENILKKNIIKIIKEKFNIDLEDIKLTNPPKKEMGDFAFNCGVLSRELKKNPNLIADDLIKNIKKIEEVESVESDGAFLNIKLSKDIFTKKFYDSYNNRSIKNEFKDFGKGEKVVIDYIGTNVGKPLHIGHMCPPNQGQAIVNIYRKLGFDVIADNHLGDWGIIFGKLITAYKMWGDEKKLNENAVEHLFHLYVKSTTEAEKHSHLDEEYRKTFKKLSTGDVELIKLWEFFTKKSIKSMQIQLDRLHVKSDYNIGESFYEGLGFPKMENYPDLKWDMKSIVKELIDKKIATKNDDNSVGVEFLEESKIPSCILQKRDGTHGYLASDLATVKYRMDNWAPKKIVYFSDFRQQLHFQQFFKISKLAGWVDNTELFHAYNGFISLKDGAMSTRKGRIIKLDALLDEAENRARKIILEKRNDLSEDELNELSKIIGIGAIKYGYLKKSRETDVIFDWDEFMTFEGNSGPYIQYSYVRSIKILEKFGGEFDIETKAIFEKEEEIELVKKLLSYRDLLERTCLKNTPHTLCSYIYELTKIFNSFYNNIHILNEEDQAKKILRLKLVKFFSDTLKDSFSLLGIEMPNKM